MRTTNKSTKNNRTNHSVENGLGESAETSRDIEKLPQSLTHTGKHSGKKYACDMCDKSYTSKYSLKTHHMSHQNVKPWQCQTCEKKFSRRYHLLRHMPIHSKATPPPTDPDDWDSLPTLQPPTNSKASRRGNLYLCKICQRMFCNRRSLQVHYMKHRGKRYPCKSCEKSFTSSDGLKLHQLSHDGLRPWICGTCGKQFRTKAHLHRHEKIHLTSPQLNICEICGKGYGCRQSLKIHIKSHTDAKPYQCHVCGSCFKYKTSLEMHGKIHKNHKDFKCLICKRTFSQKKTLQHHMGVHERMKEKNGYVLPPKEFCEICGRGLASKAGLRKHLKRHKEGTLKTFNRINNREFTLVDNKVRLKVGKEKLKVEVYEDIEEEIQYEVILNGSFSDSEGTETSEREEEQDVNKNGCGRCTPVKLSNAVNLCELGTGNHISEGFNGCDFGHGIRETHQDMVAERDAAEISDKTEVKYGIVQQQQKRSKCMQDLADFDQDKQHIDKVNTNKERHTASVATKVLLEVNGSLQENKDRSSNVLTDSTERNRSSDVLTDCTEQNKSSDILTDCTKQNRSSGVVTDYTKQNRSSDVLPDCTEQNRSSNGLADYTKQNRSSGVVTDCTKQNRSSDGLADYTKQNRSSDGLADCIKRSICSDNVYKNNVTGMSSHVDVSDSLSESGELHIHSDYDSDGTEPVNESVKQSEDNSQVCGSSNIITELLPITCTDPTTSQTQMVFNVASNINLSTSSQDRTQERNDNNARGHDESIPASKEYTCDICNKEFDLHTYTNHMRLVHLEKEIMYKCITGSCDKVFGSRLEYQQHVSYHSANVCKFCSKTFNDLNELIAHVLENHDTIGEIMDSKVKCMICNRLFGNEAAAIDHFKKHQVSRSKPPHSFDKLFECEICSKQFVREASLKRHSVVHGTAQGLACSSCGKKFAQQTHLQRHIQSKACSKDFKCSYCDQNFHTEGHLRVHQRKEHKVRAYKCPLCSKHFATSSGMHRHKRFHVEGKSEMSEFKPYMCNICGKRYTAAHSLSSHMILHTNHRPFQCDLCGNSYRQRTHLLRHVDVSHKGIKRFKCESQECGKVFADKGALMIHMRTHSGERPYKCIECGKAFSQSSILKCHVKTHFNVKDYQCQYCSQQFSTKGSAQRHVQRHMAQINMSKQSHRKSVKRNRAVVKMADKQFTCEQCDKKFTTQRAQLRHLKKYCSQKDSWAKGDYPKTVDGRENNAQGFASNNHWQIPITSSQVIEVVNSTLVAGSDTLCIPANDIIESQTTADTRQSRMDEKSNGAYFNSGQVMENQRILRKSTMENSCIEHYAGQELWSPNILPQVLPSQQHT